MSLIVAARFETFLEAEGAARALRRELRLLAENLSIFYVSPAGQHQRIPTGGDHESDRGTRHAHQTAIWIGAIGAVIGAVFGALISLSIHLPWLLLVVGGVGVGGYVGSLMGAMRGTTNSSLIRAPGALAPARHSGVVLAVQVPPGEEAETAKMLRAIGGMDIEHAEGHWERGAWQDFDAAEPPVLSAFVTPSTEP